MTRFKCLRNCQTFATSFYILASSYEFWFLHILTHTGVKWALIVILICFSLVTKMLSIFSCAYWPFACFLWRNVYSNLLPILIFLFYLLLLFFNVYLFFERERQSVSGAGAEREGDTEFEAGSKLWAVSTELHAGLKLTDRESMTWAEVGHPTDWVTQAPPECWHPLWMLDNEGGMECL